VDSQIDHVWIDRRQYSSILNVQYWPLLGSCKSEGETGNEQVNSEG
jgi:hypothetical protein